MELLDLPTDPGFIARIKGAFAAASWTVITEPDPNVTGDARKNQLTALISNLDPSRADELARKAAFVLIGAPEVQADKDAISDQNLAIVVGKVLTAYQELTALGGSL